MLWAFAVATALTLALLGVLGHFRLKRQVRQLTAMRDGMEREVIADLLVQEGADPRAATEVLDWAIPYYSKRILPHPDDDLLEHVGIDPGDVEDIVTDFFNFHRLPMPTADAPERIPTPTTLRTLTIYLTEQLRSNSHQ